mmetsp:Transcript_1173/g.3035  ORF Transcript_1173/g.3035 Transcript_1173/m.3035 type:complete len:548 (-) Transcript_1173:836-2479(-)
MMDATLKIPAEGWFNLHDEFACLGAQLKSWVCGCSPDWRQKLITWAYRSSGILSMCGSLSIVYDILKRSKKRVTTYHQLILGISLFDIIGSVAYTLIGVMAPYEAGFYLSRGNDATCTLQGFMIQLGYTSIFYNVCLSLYFVFVICYSWKESQFKRYIRYVHVVVILVGISFAFVGIPYYGNQIGICFILVPPGWEDYTPVTLLYTLPLGLGLLVLTMATVMICAKVYRQQKASMRWSLQQNMKLTRRVFWQSVLYMIAFDITLPFALASTYWQFTSKHEFWVLVVGGFVHPSQGFMNALIYFQRFDKAEFKDLFLVKQARRASEQLSGWVSTAKRKASLNFDPGQMRKMLNFSTISDSLYEPGAQQRHLGIEDNECEVKKAEDEEEDRGSYHAESVGSVSVTLRNSVVPRSPRSETDASDALLAANHSPDPHFPDHSVPFEDRGFPEDDATPGPMGEHQGKLVRWIERDSEAGTPGCVSETSHSLGSDVRNTQEMMFEATREHWRVNFLDDDDDHGDDATPARTESTPRWWRRRKSDNTASAITGR